MKHMHRMALAICLALPLAACASTLEGAAQAFSTSSVAQASDMKAAGDLYVLADHAATAYLKSGHATKEIERKMVPVEAQLHDALLAGRDAEKKGNSPAVAAALKLFNANYSSLAKMVPGLGS